MMTISREAALALHRFGLGARPGDLAEAGKDPRGYLFAQLERPEAALIPKAFPDSGATLRQFTAMRQEAQTLMENAVKLAQTRDPQMDRAMGADGKPPAPLPGPEAKPREVLVQPEMNARFEQALNTPASFLERLVLFWSNHFAISNRKSGLLAALAGPYERETIRANLLGHFEDMLIAVETHPAMLLFLDNERSVGPNSKAGQARKLSLNENLGREILELHTLGVDGGYTQTDVTSFATALTGWSMVQPKDPDGGLFIFRPNTHEPGPRTVLGRIYPQDGQQQGLAILRDLAIHPSTAKHIAWKLAAHFVADNPPPKLVALLADTFTRSRGDLKAVYRALITAPEGWQAPLTKLRSPQDFVIAAFRAAGNPPPTPQAIGIINTLGQPVLAPQSPKGYPDDAASWAAPDAIKARLDWASQLSARIGPKIDAMALADDVLGPLLDDETRTAMKRAESRPQALALMLMSPEFQRR